MEPMQNVGDYPPQYQQMPQHFHEQHQMQQQPQFDHDQGVYEDSGACLNEMGGPVKLFVGQVPRTMEEDELRQVLEVYGPLDDLIIIRDKLTGAHRGCAFASFYGQESADKAIEELHNRVTLPNSINPLQVRPAEGQAGAAQEHKLFIGMIPKSADEHAIREVFTPFGTIDEVYILRHPTTGVSKGCAFLKFKDRESAMTAIDHVNGLITMDRGSSALVVKFADSRRQRLQRARTFAQAASYWPLPPPPAASTAAAAAAFPIQQYMQQMQMFGGLPAAAMAQVQAAQAQAAAAVMGSTGMGSSTGSPTNSFLYYNPYAMTGQTYGNTGIGIGGPPGIGIGIGGGIGPPGMHGMGFDSTSPIGSGNGNGGGGGGPTSPHTAAAAAAAAAVLSVEAAAKASRTSSQMEGPSGANLFIYHLPHDLTDADLATAFAPFGSVISAKVYMDKLTGESKGFGFVSYDTPEAADAAIESMNGFQIGSKRLKVQHKRVHARFPEEMMMHESFMYMTNTNMHGEEGELGGEGEHHGGGEGERGGEGEELEAAVGQMRITE